MKYRNGEGPVQDPRNFVPAKSQFAKLNTCESLMPHGESLATVRTADQVGKENKN